MSVTVLLTAQAKADQVDAFKAYIAKCLPETRSYRGCLNIDIYEAHDSNGYFVFYENWDSVAAYESYLDYRVKQGVMQEIGTMLITEPEIVYYNRLNI